jgi:hypothetical protein
MPKIAMWQGGVLDMRSGKIFRQGYVVFRHGQTQRAVSDAKEQSIPLASGWTLVTGSYTWVQ